MSVKQITPQLFLVSLDQKIKGFTSFIGSWIYKGEVSFVVDVGPTATIPILKNALKSLEINRLEAILLTHIHIDHAGGIGDFTDLFPETPIVCHYSGIPHLTDPSKLWEGSVKTLGDTAIAYGQMKPVPKTKLISADTFDDYGITPLFTPGHAPHHISYGFKNYLFIGEAGGVYMSLPNLRLGSSKNISDSEFYLRPATPPKFFLEQSISSLELVSQYPHDTICYGHFGYSTATPYILNRHKDQLYLWENIIQEQIGQGQEKNLEFILNMLVEQDPLLTYWKEMPPEIRERERGFLLNSIRGYLGYFQSKAEGSSEK